MLAKLADLYYYSQCINFILQQVHNNTDEIKSIVSINTNYQYDFPVIRYDLDQKVPDYQLDIPPDIYIVDLTNQEGVWNFFLKIIEKSTYNHNAKYLLIGANAIYLENELSKRQISHLFQIDVQFLHSACVDRSENFSIQRKLDLNQGENLFLRDLNIKSERIQSICPWKFVPYSKCYDAFCPAGRGYMIETLELFLEHAKTAFKYKGFYSNLSFWIDPYSFLLYDNCDITVANAILLDTSWNSLLTVGYPLNEDNDVWVIPAPEPIAKWRYLVDTFSSDIWSIWLVSIMAACLFWSFLDRLSGKRIGNDIQKTFTGFLDHSLDVVKLFLEQDVNLRIPHLSQLFTVASVLLLIFIMNTLYKGRYTFLLLGPNYPKDHTWNFQEVLDTGHNVLYKHMRKSELLLRFPEIDTVAESRLLSDASDGNDWLDHVAFDRDTVSLKSYNEVRYVLGDFMDEKGKSLVKPLPYLGIPLRVGYYFLKSNPKFHKFNEFVNRLRDHGFIHHIISQYQYVPIDAQRNENLPISLDHLIGPFFLLGLGILVALLWFLVEITQRKYKRRDERIFRENNHHQRQID